MKTKPKKRKHSYGFKLIQNGVCVASVEANSLQAAAQEIWRYAFLYAQDGPVKIKGRGLNEKEN